MASISYLPGKEPHSREHRLIFKNVDRVGYDPSIDCYLREGGYEQLKKALKMEKSAITNEVKASGLRGRGGAGFPTGVKWGFIPPTNTKPVYLICNADESEPGTFKDRYIIHQDPHQLIEGMAISCFAVGAKLAYIYIHRGAGAYICGEETGLIESLEGKRPYPRIKPPYFPAALGLYMSPTIVNNVESLCHVKHILEMGSAEYAKLGTPNNTGTRILCVSGDVNKPGYYEVQVGKVTMGEVINDLCGGLKEGRQLKAIIPGGSSAKVLRADETFKLKDGRELTIWDIPMDFDTLAQCGTMAGSGGVIIMDDSRSMSWVINNLNNFYAHESCGQCTPCREGSLWMKKISDRIVSGNASPDDVDTLEQVAVQIDGRTICAFGEASAWPTQSFVRKSRDELKADCKADLAGQIVNQVGKVAAAGLEA